MGFIIIAVLYGVFSLMVPIAIIVIVIRLIVHRGNPKGGKGLAVSVADVSPKQLALSILGLAAGLAGASGLYLLPTWLLGFSDDGKTFVVRLVSGAVVLGLGVAVLRYRLVSGLLMGVGIATMLLSTPYVFENFGSKGILLIIFLVLMVLIGLTVWLSKRGKQS